VTGPGRSTLIVCTAILLWFHGTNPGDLRGDSPRGNPETSVLNVAELPVELLKENLEVRKAEIAVERALREVSGDPVYRDSTLGISGGYRRPSGGDQMWNTGADLSITVLPQVSLGGGMTVDQDGRREEEVSLTLRPLAPGRTTFRQEESLQVARIRLDYTMERVSRQVERAALDVLIAEMEEELAELTLALEERKYELVQRQQEVGAASFQDVQDQISSLVDARRSIFNGRRQYVQARNSLERLFAPGDAPLNIRPLTRPQLEELIELRRRRMHGGSDSSRNPAPRTEALDILRVRLVALEAELASTPVWRPSLDITGGVTFPDGATEEDPTSFGTVRLTLSPEQIRRDDRTTLQEDIRMLRLDMGAERYSAELEESLRRQSIDIYDEAFAAALLQEERDMLSYREAELLLQQGGRTALEVEQIRLNLRRSEIHAFRAAAELFTALGEYTALFVDR
jgi:hypothetical protein